MKNNPTLSRKTSNTMKPKQGLYKPVARASQSGDGADFAFNGQMGDGVNRDNSRDGVCVNQQAHRVRNPDSINFGLIEANRRGNASDSYRDRMEGVGPSATRDAHKRTISTAAEGGRIDGGADCHPFANPDAINVGMKR
jgi:hypothetical protein